MTTTWRKVQRTLRSFSSSLKHNVKRLTWFDFSWSTDRASIACDRYLFTRFVGWWYVSEWLWERKEQNNNNNNDTFRRIVMNTIEKKNSLVRCRGKALTVSWKACGFCPSFPEFDKIQTLGGVRICNLWSWSMIRIPLYSHIEANKHLLSIQTFLLLLWTPPLSTPIRGLSWAARQATLSLLLLSWTMDQCYVIRCMGYLTISTKLEKQRERHAFSQ